MSGEKKQQSHGHGGAHAGLTFGERLLAGGVAGMVECLIMYPLDVVKTLQQIHVGKGQNTLALLKQLIGQEGFGVYRGIIAPLLMETPKRAIKFTANETFQPLLANKDGKLDQMGAFGAGLGAGVTETFIIVPFELVKIRMQARENMGKYANTFDAVRKIVAEEGVMTFYKGLESTLWRNGVWNSAYFGVMHYLRERVTVSHDQKTLTAFRDFGIGFVGGTIATTLNTPFDVVKSRIQNSTTAASWTLPELYKVATKEGVRALYKGYTPKLLRLGPGGGILNAAFSFIANKIKARKAAKHQEEASKH